MHTNLNIIFDMAIKKFLKQEFKSIIRNNRQLRHALEDKLECSPETLNRYIRSDNNKIFLRKDVIELIGMHLRKEPAEFIIEKEIETIN